MDRSPRRSPSNEPTSSGADAALREREELIQLEEAVRVRDQVVELQHENEMLRAQLACEQAERSVLAAQLQQALILAASMAGQRVLAVPT